ncbi:MAG TPA: hypothetical protein DCZ20_02330 [Lachnospiraceae bacterium]|nr:hypothetical protein [Lachnospiraceae bacterium]
MKRNDWILLALICVFAGLLLLWQVLRPAGEHAEVTIKVDGEVYGTYSLQEEQKIPIGSSNVLLISDGKARMLSADCPDQICVHQKAIAKRGESIICLPNQIIVEVTEGAEAELDAVAQ